MLKFRREGAEVNIIGMNEVMRTVVDKFGVYDKPEEVEKLMAALDEKRNKLAVEHGKHLLEDAEQTIEGNYF